MNERSKQHIKRLDLVALGLYQKLPNKLGLYDMLGICTHWVRDRCDMAADGPFPKKGTIPSAAFIDDYHGTNGNCGVICGSGVGTTMQSLRVADRPVLRPTDGPGDSDSSFRLIMEE